MCLAAGDRRNRIPSLNGSVVVRAQGGGQIVDERLSQRSQLAQIIPW